MRLQRADLEDALSSDARAGWSARISIRERHRRVLKDRWRFLGGFAAAALVVFGVASLFASSPLQRGLVLGGGVVLAGCMTAAFVVLVAGTAPLMMGELAEQWTAQELRPLRKPGWRLINHFGLGFGDLDHVLVGPGGVVLVETKWGATPWDLDDRDFFFRSAVQQTVRNAQQLQRWHGVAQFGRPPVEPVLVLWGQASKELTERPPRRHPSGVLVMSGQQLQDWALRRGRNGLAPEQIAGIWAQIEQHAHKRDTHERARRPMPRSLFELAMLLLGTVVAALVGVMVTAQILSLVESLQLWCVSGGGLLGLAELVRRRSRWPLLLRGFQAGVLATYAMAAAVVLRAYLTT